MSGTFSDETLIKLWAPEETPSMAAALDSTWDANQTLMNETLNLVLARFKESDLVATNILSIKDIRRAFMLLVQEMQAQSVPPTDTIANAQILAGLAAFGNKRSAFARMKKAKEFGQIMTKMKVVTRYVPENPTSFPLRFYSRLFPRVTHEVAETHVVPRFWPLIQGPIKSLANPVSDVAIAQVKPYCYPGSAAACPEFPEGLMNLWRALNTAISIIISRKRDGEGTWSTVKLEDTERFRIIALGDDNARVKGVWSDINYDAVAYLRRFCSGGLYNNHLTYGPAYAAKIDQAMQQSLSSVV